MLPIAAIYLFTAFFKALLAIRYTVRYPRPDASIPMENATICQPILSGDPELERTLRASLQSLPEPQFLWLLDYDDIIAQDIAAKIKYSAPTLRINIVLLPSAPKGINPKLFKLEAGRELVTTPYIVILDDDTQLPRTSLQGLLAGLERAELVTGLPYYRKSDKPVTNLLGQFVNNNSAQVYLSLLDFVDPVSINGMCYAMRTAVLSEMNGFQTIQSHLTDDLAVAEMVNKHGGRIIQMPLIQEVGTDIQTIGSYFSQMHRWSLFSILLMRRQSIGVNTAIIFLHGLPPLLLLSICILAIANPTQENLFVAFLLLVFRSFLLCIVQNKISRQIRHSPLLSIVSELLQPLHLMHAFFWRKIKWRSRRYRVFDNNHFEPYD